MKRFWGICAWLFVLEAHAQFALPPVVVTAKRLPRVFDAQPSGLGQPVTLAPNPDAPLEQQLVDEGMVYWEASNSMGLATSTGGRGFALISSASLGLGRVFLNSHADVGRFFVRDPATVELVSYLPGHDATLLGGGNPAGSLHYQSKTPHGTPATEFSARLGSQGEKRMTLDWESSAGLLQWRTVLAHQQGGKTVDGAMTDRSTALISLALPTPWGRFRFDQEWHENRLPFPFGTVYANQQFWFDISYMDAAKNTAKRSTNRQELQWEFKPAPDTKWLLYHQHARTQRDEQLVGFWSFAASAPLTTLDGYLRTITEDFTQRDSGLRLELKKNWGGWTHDLTLLTQWHEQQLDAELPQNYNAKGSGFVLDIANPVFPADISQYALTPSWQFERLSERAQAISDVMRYGPWDIRWGLRNAEVNVGSTRLHNQAIPLLAHDKTVTPSVGIGYRLNQEQRVWWTQSRAYLPNRAKDAQGEFLPARRSRQDELGWQWQAAPLTLGVSAFELLQYDIPGIDPQNKNAYILIGSTRSKGYESRLQWQQDLWQVKWTHTRLDAGVQQATSVGQGMFLPGAPDQYGAAKVEYTAAPALQTWLGIQYSGDRPGDAKASFYAPGYAVWNLGLQSPGGTSEQAWHWGVEVRNLADLRYVRGLTAADNVWQGERRQVYAFARRAW